MHLHSPVVLNHHVGPHAVKSSHFSLQRTPWLEVWTYVSLYIYNCLISMHRIVIGGRFFELYKIRLFSGDKESTLELPGHSMIRFFFITGDGLTERYALGLLELDPTGRVAILFCYFEPPLVLVA